MCVRGCAILVGECGALLLEYRVLSVECEATEDARVFRENVGLFWKNIGLFRKNIGLFWKNVGLF